MRLYVFRQRLCYKCSLLKVGYKEVGEAYTSKICSVCENDNDKNVNNGFIPILNTFRINS
jgi:transposase